MIRISVNIGNKNIIKNSTVGNNNTILKEDKKINVLVHIIIPILIGIIIAGIVFYLGWN